MQPIINLVSIVLILCRLSVGLAVGADQPTTEALAFLE